MVQSDSVCIDCKKSLQLLAKYKCILRPLLFWDVKQCRLVANFVTACRFHLQELWTA